MICQNIMVCLTKLFLTFSFSKGKSASALDSYSALIGIFLLFNQKKLPKSIYYLIKAIFDNLNPVSVIPGKIFTKAVKSSAVETFLLNSGLR